MNTFHEIVDALIISGDFARAKKDLVELSVKLGSVAYARLQASHSRKVPHDKVIITFDDLAGSLSWSSQLMTLITDPGSHQFRDMACIIQKIFGIGVLQDEECFWFVNLSALSKDIQVPTSIVQTIQAINGSTLIRQLSDDEEYE